MYPDPTPEQSSEMAATINYIAANHPNISREQIAEALTETPIAEAKTALKSSAMFTALSALVTVAARCGWPAGSVDICAKVFYLGWEAAKSNGIDIDHKLIEMSDHD